MDTELEKAMRDKIDYLAARLSESEQLIKELTVKNEEFKNSIESHLDRISGLNGQVEALTFCIKILAEKL